MLGTPLTTPCSVAPLLGRYPASRAALSAEEEGRLARAWRNRHDRESRDRLVTANLGLVVSIAQRYRNAGTPLDELIAEGNIGLLSAVDGFDPDCGSRFSTYAVYWIRQGIGRAFAAGSPRGRLNGRERHDLATLDRESKAHYARTGSEPTDAELARHLAWPLERVAACRSKNLSHARPCSLDAPRPDGSGPAIQPAGSGAPSCEDAHAAGAAVDSLLRQLSPFERSAVEMRFGLHGAEVQSVDAIARALDRTRAQTRAALRVAMNKLSRSGRTRHLSGPAAVPVVGDGEMGQDRHEA